MNSKWLLDNGFNYFPGGLYILYPYIRIDMSAKQIQIYNCINKQFKLFTIYNNVSEIKKYINKQNILNDRKEKLKIILND